MKQFIYLYITVCLTGMAACTKFVELDPPVNALTDETAYLTSATATSVMTGLFQSLVANQDLASGDQGLSVLTGIQTDELTYYLENPQQLQFATSTLLADNSSVLSVWARAYKTIYGTNAAIEGVTNSNTLSPSVKDQLIGEAKFMRAFMYFYLVNLYGKVPLALTTDYEVNTSLSRSEVDLIYEQIVTDLKDAQTLLTAEYLSATNQVTTSRVRPNRGAATAMLARVYLYMRDWVNAEATATEVINQQSVYQMEDVSTTFLASSKEAIWQLGFGANSGINTWEGMIFIINFSPVTSYPGITLNDDQMEVMNGDNRVTNWTKDFVASGVAYPHAFKYKVYRGAANSTPTEHLIALRLAEQYLIRAEARAMQGRLIGANGGIADINEVRLRSNQPLVSPADLTAFMHTLESERRIELFTEWGHRWLDIKRWDGFNNPGITRADEIMPAIAASRGGTWKPGFKLWPVPEKEIAANVNLDQNDEYPR